MKAINLGKSVIFIDDIEYIYEKEVTGEYHNRTEYYIVTKVGKFEVEKFVYKEVKEYLLSLNEEAENIEAKRIDKAIDYMNYNANYNNFFNELTSGLSVDNCNELLKILRGDRK